MWRLTQQTDLNPGEIIKFPPGLFGAAPKVMIGLSMIAMTWKANLRFDATVKFVPKDDMLVRTLDIGDAKLYGSNVKIIAIL